MAFGSPRTPGVPTPPQGEEIASFATYLEAQKAVDVLADSNFAVRAVTIVGTDLKMVERVTARLTYPRAALGGALSGMWLGLFVGLMFGLFANSLGNVMVTVLTCAAIGAAFGMFLAVVSYALSGGKRDFTSQSQVVASRYSVLCLPDLAPDARDHLRQQGIATTSHAVAQRGGAAGAPTAAARPAQPAVVARPVERPAGPPRYGARQEDVPGAATGGSPAAGDSTAQPGPGATHTPAPRAGAADSGPLGAPRYGQRVQDGAPAGAPAMSKTDPAAAQHPQPVAHAAPSPWGYPPAARARREGAAGAGTPAAQAPQYGQRTMPAADPAQPQGEPQGDMDVDDNDDTTSGR
ncbi:general stress protein [Serinibacter salmoneus]|uniref:General stress protein 17M-like domain-containing protein n=1 Tax=Serinibacter salmoneus TaxID=556530 RepID=A0A2A9CZU6_9MICO|nr:general stress protein [Serinibacter salmoneus]PFG19119.1 hypothetical protein ATL40_0675 [Serinibacter salmoneus]